MTSPGRAAKSCTQNPGAVSTALDKAGFRGGAPSWAQGFLGRSTRTKPGGRGPAPKVIFTRADGSVVNAAEAVTCPQCSDSLTEYLLFSWCMFIVGQMRIHICRQKRGENICSAKPQTQPALAHRLTASLGPGCAHGSWGDCLGPGSCISLCLGFLILNGMLIEEPSAVTLNRLLS